MIPLVILALSSTGCLAVWAGLQSPHQVETSVREIPARSIPVPSSVSPQLRDRIAQPIEQSMKDMRSLVLATPAEWRQKIESMNRYLAGTFVSRVRRKFPARVEATLLGGVRCFVVTPSTCRAANRNRLLIHLHGGAYIIGGGEAGLTETLLMAHYSGTKVIFVDYRMPPDHPFPAAIDDAVAVWRAAAKKWKPTNIGIGGSSSGGGLTLAVLSSIRRLGLPMPGAAFAGTPWADLASTGDTIHTNEWIDGSLTTHEGFLDAVARLYAGQEPLNHPLVSPLYGEFKGFPPTILVAGTRDLLLSDTVRVHRKLRRARVEAQLNVIEGLSHDQYTEIFDSPESLDVWTEVARFFDGHLGR